MLQVYKLGIEVCRKGIVYSEMVKAESSIRYISNSQINMNTVQFVVYSQTNQP